MKNLHVIRLVLLAGIGFLLANCQPADSGIQGDPLTYFNIRTAEWKDAYNSGDAKNLEPLYAEDAQYISSHVEGLVAEGRQALLANFQKGMSGGGHIDSIRVDRLDLSCDMATLFCTYNANNNGMMAEGHNLLVLKRTGDIWLIVLHMTVV